MAKFNSLSLYKAAAFVLSLVLWVYLLIVSTLLRPVADEICVLGELEPGESFPPFHFSPRFLASLFTWLSSTIWMNNYSIAIVTHWLIISILLSFNIRALYRVFSGNISRTQAHIFGFVLTPFFLLFLPHKNQAIYDSFYWFGGTWHTIGALFAMYLTLIVINQETKLPLLIGLVILGALWSEVTSIVVAVALAVSAITYKSKKGFLVLIPLLSIALHAYLSLNSGRLDVSAGSAESFFDLNTIKGLVLMYLVFSAHGLAIAATSSLWMSPDIGVETPRLNRTQVAAVISLAAAGVTFFLASAFTYATWRSTAIFGFFAFGIGMILWQGFARNTLFIQIISSVTLPLIILTNIEGIWPMIDVLEIRKDWWESNKSVNWFSISDSNLSQEQRAEIPADWGKGEWVDQCFVNLEGTKS